MIEPVVVENRTKKSPEDAFRFFVEEIHSFWPMGHSIGEEPRTDLIIELKKGGRFYEVCGSTECDWVAYSKSKRENPFYWHGTSTRSGSLILKTTPKCW